MTEKSKLIVKLLVEKGTLKQKIFDNTLETLRLIKQISRQLETELNSQLTHVKDARINLRFRNISPFQAELKVAGDLLVFFMHSNIFKFNEKTKPWKNEYLKNDPLNAYVGIIRIYNFLADSFKYNRTEDLGLLLTRIFVDKNKNLWLEQLTLNNKTVFSSEPLPITPELIRQILEQNILFAMNFDLEVLDYETVKLTTVNDIIEARKIGSPTGKIVGFNPPQNDTKSDQMLYTGG